MKRFKSREIQLQKKVNKYNKGRHMITKEFVGIVLGAASILAVITIGLYDRSLKESDDI